MLTNATDTLREPFLPAPSLSSSPSSSSSSSSSTLEPMEVEVLPLRPAESNGCTTSHRRHYHHRRISSHNNNNSNNNNDDDYDDHDSHWIDRAGTIVGRTLEQYPKTSLVVFSLTVLAWFTWLHTQFGWHHLHSKQPSTDETEGWKHFFRVDVDDYDMNNNNNNNNKWTEFTDDDARPLRTTTTGPEEKVDHSSVYNDPIWKSSSFSSQAVVTTATTCQTTDQPAVSREDRSGWMEAHEANEQRIQSVLFPPERTRSTSKSTTKTRFRHNRKHLPPSHIDVVFLGDDVTEIWNGKWLNGPVTYHPDGRLIQDYWNRTFEQRLSLVNTNAHEEGEGPSLQGLALGIAGDTVRIIAVVRQVLVDPSLPQLTLLIDCSIVSLLPPFQQQTANLLWRLQHGELPDELSSKVWWILIGSNDLGRTGCTEEETVLGILRVAEYVHARQADHVIVLQGILPRSNRLDGRLLEEEEKIEDDVNNEKKDATTPSSTKRVRREDEPPLWPSIVSINEQLKKFCELHDHLVYFDATDLFVKTTPMTFESTLLTGSAPSSSSSSPPRSRREIIKHLMPDFLHPSAQGMQVMGDAIAAEVARILQESFDDDARTELAWGNTDRRPGT